MMKIEQRTDFVEQPPSVVHVNGQSYPCERTTIISRAEMKRDETEELFLTSDDFNTVSVCGFGCLVQSCKFEVEYPIADQYLDALTCIAKLILPPGARFQIIAEQGFGNSWHIGWRYDRTWQDGRPWDSLSEPIADMSSGSIIVARRTA